MAFVVPALAAIGGGSAAVGAMTAASLAATAYSAVKASKQKAPAIQAPEKPPQVTKAPERAPMFAAMSAASRPGGSMSGNSGTFLTGPSGIDNDQLNLGRNTLLGR